VGLVWLARGRDDLLRPARRWSPPEGSRLSREGKAWVGKLSLFAASARHDFLQAGGFLVIGAAVAATVQTVVPRSIVDSFAQNPILSVLGLALLAVVLSLCSEADAFVAAGLHQFSLSTRLVFLVVGPMIDLKLIALQAGTFGPRFTARFAPLTFVAAVGCALLVGWWLL